MHHHFFLQSRSLIFLSLFQLQFISNTILATNPNQDCPPSICGNLHNIRYPFRLSTDSQNCGDPDYELTCETNQTVLYLTTGKYNVLSIFYEDQTINILNSNIPNTTCPVPQNPLWQTITETDYQYRYDPLSTTEVSLVNCSKPIEDPLFTQVPCLGGNQTGLYFYLVFEENLVDLLERPCLVVAMAPVGEKPKQGIRDRSFGSVRGMLGKGFNLSWSLECRDCRLAGRACNFDSLGGSSFYTDCVAPTCSTICHIGQIAVIIQSAVLMAIESVPPLLLGLFVISRFIFAPICIFVFLLVKFCQTKNAH